MEPHLLCFLHYKKTRSESTQNQLFSTGFIDLGKQRQNRAIMPLKSTE